MPSRSARNSGSAVGSPSDGADGRKRAVCCKIASPSRTAVTIRRPGSTGAGVRHPRGMNSRLVTRRAARARSSSSHRSWVRFTCRDPVAADGRLGKGSISSRRYEEDMPAHAHTPSLQSHRADRLDRVCADRQPEPGVSMTISSETLRSISTARAALPEPRTVLRAQTTHTNQPRGHENDPDATSKGP